MTESIYQKLFDESPVSIWIEDFSGIYDFIKDLRSQNVQDIRAHLMTYPEKLAQCATSLRVIDVNKTTLKMYGVSSKEELVSAMPTILGEDAKPMLLETIVSLSEGRRFFEGQGINYKADGTKLFVRVSWSLAGNEKEAFDYVIVAVQDITAQHKSQAEREEREKLFRCIFEQSSEGIIILNKPGNVILVNETFERMLGMPALKIVGRPVWEVEDIFASSVQISNHFILGEHRIKDLLSKCTTEPMNMEYQFYDSHNKLHAYKQTLVAITTSEEPIYALIVSDVTAAKRSEIITEIMRQISHAINVTDSLDDLYKLIHEALSQLLDVTNFYIAQYDRKSNLITFPYMVDQIAMDNSPVEADNSNSLTAQLISEAKTLLLNEKEIYDRIGKNVLGAMCQNWLGIPLIVSGEVIGALVLQSYDKSDQYNNDDKVLLESISEHIAYALQKKQADESITILIQAIEQAGEGIVIFTPEGYIRYVNTIFEKITGYNRNELLEKPFEFLPFEPSNRDEMQRQWIRVRSSQPWHGKIEMVRKDNQRITLDMVVKPVIDNEGKLSSIIASCNDITYQILRDEQQKRVQKLEAIGRLTGGIAHDFNNILSAIIGYTELASDGVTTDSETAKNLTEVLKSASRAKEMIQHLIAFSKQEESRTEVIDFVDHVKEALRFLRSYLPRSVMIKEEFLTDDVTVLAVPGQMHQILINLGTNAMQAMSNESGVIKVIVDTVAFSSKDMIAYPELEQTHYVRLRVIDNGDGIDLSIIDRIFDPYFTTKASSLGTGLGLAIVHSIVQSHHGAIRVESVIGTGTTFTVLLPQYNATSWPPSTLEVVDEADLTGTEHIMFIDDELMLVSVFKQGLIKLGYRVEGFTDPRKAEDYFNKNYSDIDLVITDTTMPYINGIDLAVKMLNRCPDLPIILCTGFTTLISAEEAARKGISDFIMKPYKTKDLAARIRHLLDKD
jgi:PAS domain S-box-containing protein